MEPTPLIILERFLLRVAIVGATFAIVGLWFASSRHDCVSGIAGHSIEGEQRSPPLGQVVPGQLERPSRRVELENSALIDDTARRKMLESEPEAAAAQCDCLATNDPETAAITSEALLTAWCESGQLRRAARFALASQSPNRVAWLASVFRLWGASNPEEAWQCLTGAGSKPGAARAEAAAALLNAWANRAPEELAGAALQFENSADRTMANTELFSVWINTDAPAALEWLRTLAANSEADGAVANLANATNLLRQNPENATLLAMTIDDPILRANTLAQLADIWAQRDSPGLRDFLHEARLKSADQSALSAALESIE